MKVQWIFVVALTLTAIALFFVNFRIVKPEEKHTTDWTQGGRDNTQKELSGQNSSTQTDTRLRRLASGHVEYKPALEASRAISEVEKPREALVLIQQILSHYRFAYKENPIGVENFEITEQLLGQNPKKIIFINADNPALRGNELIDQWNTPYFFHALSGQVMEVQSAGPDKMLWTVDDIVLEGEKAP